MAALNEAKEVRDIEERRAVEVEGEEGEMCLEKTSMIWFPWASTECLTMKPDSGINANSMRGGRGLNAVERVDGAMGEDVKED